MKKFDWYTLSSVALTSWYIEDNALEKLEIIMRYNNSRNPSRVLTLKGTFTDDSYQVRCLGLPKEVEEISFDCDEAGFGSPMMYILENVTRRVPKIELETERTMCAPFETHYTIYFK